MKIELERKIEYFEVNPDFTITLGSMFRRLQEAAVLHSEKAGLGTKFLAEKGRAWVLNRMGINIHRYPHYLEPLKVVTWHRYSEGFRSYRDFEIFSRGEKVAEASSLWIFVDLENKKILRAPENTSNDYQSEDDRVKGLKIESWKPEIKFSTNFSTDITMRSTDYDPLGHVNSAVYFDFIETLFSLFMKNENRISTIKIQFAREIGIDARSVKAGLKENGDSYLYRIYNSKILFASGCIKTLVF